MTPLLLNNRRDYSRMENARKLSSTICYLSGVFGLTIAGDISDVLGVVVSCISAISMLICLIINLISTIKKSMSDGKIDEKEREEINKQIEQRKGTIKHDNPRNDSGTNDKK